MIGLGTKCYKDNFDSKLYARMADFCNSTMSYQIEDKGEYYEIVERVIEEPSEKELLQREKAELEAEIEKLKQELAPYDYIGVKISMGVATKEEYADKIAYTETLRKKIRELESKLVI